MSYVSLDSGTPHVFVSPFPDVTASRTQVTPAGGSQPRWARDGRTLFYTGLDGRLMSVTTNLKDPLEIGPPVSVLATAYYGGLTVISRNGKYDVAADGRRFLMIKGADEGSGPPDAQIIVVRNWYEELRRLLPDAR
jgi:serine/threonine-protein kinase